MANLKKSFNFRHGVQVDDDNFIVDTLGRVGIGSTIPSEFFDVGGNIRIRGTVFANEVNTDSLLNTSEDGIASFKLVNVGITSITNGVIQASTGIVTYYGDARYLQGMPTSQWVDTDVGLGYTSIYAAGNVGIATTDPRYNLQIGAASTLTGSITEGVGISSSGYIVLTGGIDASSSGIISAFEFKGSGSGTAEFIGIGSELTGLDADNIAYGTIPSNKFGDLNVGNIYSSSGIITATSFIGTTFTGNFVGIATTARDLTSDAIIDIDAITSNRSVLGVTTTTTLQANTLYTVTSVGIGTSTVSADLHLRKDGVAEVQITSNDDRARLVIGRDTTAFGNNFIIDTDNDDVGAYPEESGLNSVDIYNYATGNLNFFIRPDTEINKKFNWINHSTSDTMMSLTQDGRLGIGKTNPDHDLHVVGTSTVTSNSFVGGNFAVTGVSTFYDTVGFTTTVEITGILRTKNKIGVGLTDGDSDPVEDFEVGSNGVKLSSNGDANFIGIVTAAYFYGDGSDLTAITPENISSGSISGAIDINAGSGIVTATRFVGSGSSLTAIPASEITGDLGAGININTSGIITATRFVGSGVSLTDLNGSEITSGTIGDVNINTSGIITAANFVGVGTQITELNPSEIQDGSISGNIDINIGTGIVTAAKFAGIGSNLTNLKPSNIQSGVFASSLVSTEVVGLGVSADHTGNISEFGKNKVLMYDGKNNYFQSSVGYADTVVTSSAGVANELIKFDLTSPDDVPNYDLEFRSLDVQILVINGDKYQSSKVLIVHNSVGGIGIETYSNIILNNSNNDIVKYNATYTSGIDDRNLHLNAVPEAGISGITTYKVSMTTLS